MFFTVERSGTDGERIGSLRCGCLARFFALLADLLSVRVASHGSVVLNNVSIAENGGISVPPCATSEGGFLQGVVCVSKHGVPSKIALLMGSAAADQDGDPDGIPLALGEGNGDGCGFVHGVVMVRDPCPACAYPIRSVGGSLPPWWTVLRSSQ